MAEAMALDVAQEEINKVTIACATSYLLPPLYQNHTKFKCVGVCARVERFLTASDDTVRISAKARQNGPYKCKTSAEKKVSTYYEGVQITGVIWGKPRRG